MMVKQMAEIGYDANKLPLGKLSKSTILMVSEITAILAAFVILHF